MKYDKKLHEALVVIAEHKIDCLSYEGQELWNKLAQIKEVSEND